jgi:hypothetical protein
MSRNAIDVHSFVTRSGKWGTFKHRCKTFDQMARRLTAELSSHARIEYHQHVGGLEEMTELACSMRDASVILPPHPLKSFRRVVESLSGFRPIVIGINGGGDVVDANSRAFNIGVHDPLGRLAAVDGLLGRIRGDRRVVFVGQPSRAERAYGRNYEIQLAEDISVDELAAALERSLGRCAEDIVVLAVTNELGPTCVAALERIEFIGTLVRERATSFEVPISIETIDAMGNYRDLPTLRVGDLYRRSMGRSGSLEELSELMDIAWRLDAIQLIAEGVRANRGSELIEAVRSISSERAVLQGLTRRVSFDERGMNSFRETVLVKRSRGARAEHLHEMQLRPDGSCLPVAFVSCEFTHVDVINVATSQFEAEFEVEVASIESLDPKSIIFPSAVNAPQMLLQSRTTRPKLRDSELDLHVLRARVRGCFYFDPDIAAYPFDVQRLPMRIEIRHNGQTLPVQPLQVPAVRTQLPHDWELHVAESAPQLLREVDLHPSRWPDGALDWIEREHAVVLLTVHRRPVDGMMRALVPNAVAILASSVPGLLSISSSSFLVSAYGVLLGFFLTDSRPIAGKLTRVDWLYIASILLLLFKGIASLLVGEGDATHGIDPDAEFASSTGVLLLGSAAAVWFAWPQLRAKWLRADSETGSAQRRS